MTKEDLIKILESLKNIVFLSEAHLQHEFAWRIHKKYNDAINVIVEKPCPEIQGEGKGMPHVDIWLESSRENYAIELKYKTKETKNDPYKLKNHSAQNEGRYAFVSDIARLQDLKLNKGFAIFLTNDPAYSKVNDAQGKDREFRLHNGKLRKGSHKWHVTPDASEETKKKEKKKFPPISLRRYYDLKWKSFIGTFQYLLVEV